MAFIHHKWESHGRTYTDDENSSKRMYSSYVGERQTPDGLGSYFPYIFHSETNKIQYGLDSSSIEFASDKQILKRAADTICSSFKLYVEAYVGSSWVSQPHGVAERNFHQDEIFRDGGWETHEGKCTGFLSFPDAHLSYGAENSYNLFVGLEAGNHRLARLGMRFRASDLSPASSGQIRFVIELDGIKKLPSDWEWIEQYNEEEDETRRVGIRVKDFEWRWTWDEAPYRDIVKVDNPDDTMKIQVIMGPYNYDEGDWLTIYPDTWGATEASDDCFQQNSDYYDNSSNTLYVGHFLPDFDLGWIWNNVAVPNTATLQDGCKITVNVTFITGSLKAVLKAVDENPPPAWSDSEKPTDKAVYGTTVTWNESSLASQDSPEIKTMMQQIIDDVAWDSGDDLAVVWMDNNSYEAYLRITAEEGGTGAELTLVYSLPAETVETSIDSLLSKIEMVDFSIDSLLQKTIPVTLSIDSLMSALNTIQTSLDAEFLKTDIEKITSIDSLLKKIGIETTLSIDAIIKKQFLKTTTVGALLNKVGLASDSYLDAILYALSQSTAITTIDALLNKTGLTVNSSLDALLNKTGLTVNSSLDAIIYTLEHEIKSTHIDSLLNKIGLSSAATIDSLLQESGLTSDILLDAFISKTGLTAETSLDAILYLLNVAQSQISIDSLLQNSGILATLNMDSLISQSTEEMTLLEALLQKQITTDLYADALIVKTQTGLTNIDAGLTYLQQININLDANLYSFGEALTYLEGQLSKEGQTAIATLDAGIYQNVLKTSVIDSILNGALSKQIDINALLNKSQITSSTLIDAIIFSVLQTIPVVQFITLSEKAQFMTIFEKAQFITVSEKPQFIYEIQG